jgi:hypothetical protein
MTITKQTSNTHNVTFLLLDPKTQRTYEAHAKHLRPYYPRSLMPEVPDRVVQVPLHHDVPCRVEQKNHNPRMRPKVSNPTPVVKGKFGSTAPGGVADEQMAAILHSDDSRRWDLVQVLETDDERQDGTLAVWYFGYAPSQKRLPVERKQFVPGWWIASKGKTVFSNSKPHPDAEEYVAIVDRAQVLVHSFERQEDNTLNRETIQLIQRTHTQRLERMRQTRQRTRIDTPLVFSTMLSAALEASALAGGPGSACTQIDDTVLCTIAKFDPLPPSRV